MPQARVLILRAPGTNCDQETAFAFEQAGGRPLIVHVNRLLESPAQADEYQILCLPGGFSYGDDIAAGRIVAGQIRHHLTDLFQQFRESQKLVLGICNGFQILLKSGMLLPDDDHAGPPATLTWNESGHYQDRWVHVRVDQDRCVFLRGIDQMYLPIAHAEGRFVARNAHTLTRLASTGQLALRYSREDDGLNDPNTLLPFPLNPNGSQANVAGVCDQSGRIFGMMPHPERHMHFTHHPRWTRRNGEGPPDGLQVFRNAVTYFD